MRRIRSRVNTTSAVVTGTPSDHSHGLMANRQVWPPSGVVTAEARLREASKASLRSSQTSGR